MAMMESKWYVKACYDEGFHGLHIAIATDNWSDIEEFVWEYVQKGLNCLIVEHETGKQQYAFAEDFNETTVEPSEIIRATKKNWREKEEYEMLRLEQQGGII